MCINVTSGMLYSVQWWVLFPDHAMIFCHGASHFYFIMKLEILQQSCCACHDFVFERPLQPLTGEKFISATA